MKFVKSNINHCEFFLLGFFIVQYAKWSCIISFSITFAMSTKIEELEMDTDSLCLVLQKKFCMNVSSPASEQSELKSGTTVVETISDKVPQTFYFFTRTCFSKLKKT